MAYCPDCNGEIAVLVEDCPRRKFIQELKEIVACKNHADGYLVKWAKDELEKVGVKID